MVAEAFPLLYGKFPNYYELLGVPRNASKKDVISAYKKTALREHPDKAGGTALQNELFAAINNAKSVLIDDGLRKTYDYKLNEHLRPKAPPPAEETFIRPGGYSFPSTSKPFGQFGQPPRGTKSARPPTFKPFGAGTGFGPERNAAPRDPFGSTSASSGGQASSSADYTSKFSRSDNRATGCPVCGSPFCAGSRYVGQGGISDIPCSYKNNPFFSQPQSPDARPFTSFFGNRSSKKASDSDFSRSRPEPIFGFSSKAKVPTSPQCTGDPYRCVKHHSAHSEQIRWKEPFPLEGDPGYVDPERTIPFQYFIPPASAYDRQNHRGTKPSTSAWLQARWKCLSLPNEHQSATNVAMDICDVAIVIDGLIERLAQHCAEFEWLFSGEQSYRLVAAFDLLKEIMHFAAGSYRYSGSLIDSSIYNRPDVAVPRLVAIRNDLTAILRIMRGTRMSLEALITTMAETEVDMDLRILGEGIRSIMVAWDQVVLLPGNITQGCQDVFFSRSGRLENIFERKSKVAWASYPNKPFMYKKPEGKGLDKASDTWTVDDEEPTLQKWEMGQRTREALREREKVEMQATAGWANSFNALGTGSSGQESDVDMSG